MAKRNNVKVKIHQQNIFGSMIEDGKHEPDTIKELIGWLGEMLLEVPEEYRDSAKLEIDSVGGYEGEHHSEVEIFYTRPETDEEMNDRIATLRQHVEEDLQRHEQYAAQARLRLERP